MKVSLNWVRQFTDIDVSTDELVKLATERLGGIEGVTELGKHYEGIVVAKVVSCEKHPNADKLSLCKIDDGGAVKDVVRDENGCVQVVCGAPNVREGLLVAWIPPGAIVPASYGEKELFVLEARDLRGETSNGMLASPAELGMSDDHTGILEISHDQLANSNALTISNEQLKPKNSESQVASASQIANRQLPIELKPGLPFSQLYDLDDVILEIENKMFTHRPDGFGQLGVAREIAGIQHKLFTSPDWYLRPVIPGSIGDPVDKDSRLRGNDSLSVTIEADDLCPRYMAVCLDNVEIKPSPLWLQSYLKRVGVRPINNVVDITNYMMMLTAQPLHAFDLDKIAQDSRVDITVRRPKPGETMTLLDGKQIEPHTDAVLICNPSGPIALGGVMGGGNSEVDEGTKRVVLECATFDMYNIRKTSMIHGLFTDAVTRFTKGQPPAQLPPVIYKAIQMFEELTGAKTIGKVVDSPQSSALSPQSSRYIEVEPKFINERLGTKLSTEDIIKLLTNVEFQAHEASGPISVTPPFWRTDIEIPEDIVEEVGRLYGFNRLPVALPQRSIAPVYITPQRLLKQRLRQTLTQAGANEVLTYSFVHGDLLKKIGQKADQAYALRNALSPDLQYYRQSITPNLLELVHPNSKAGYKEFALYEIGKVHSRYYGQDAEDLPKQMNVIALTIAATGTGFFLAKRYLSFIGEKLGLNFSYQPITEALDIPTLAPFETARSAFVVLNDQPIGVIGEYRSEVIKSLKLPPSLAGFEVDTDALAEAFAEAESGYQPLSKYPSTEQDITLKVAQEVPYAELEDCLKRELEATEYHFNINPVSIYQAEDSSTKNVTFRITLTHYQRTLTTAEVTALVEKLSWRAHERLTAEQV